MPNVMNPSHLPHHTRIDRTAPQRVAIALGVAFIIFGFLGMIIPDFMRMHLSIAQNFINFVIGALALSVGLTNARKAFNFCLGLGAFFGILGIAGFLMGLPGYPAVGYLEADQNLFRIFPGYLEYGTIDHVAHLVLCAFLIFTAYTFRKDRPGLGLTERTK